MCQPSMSSLSCRRERARWTSFRLRAGRCASRTAQERNFGYLLLPLFLETEAGESVEEALERTGFQEAWECSAGHAGAGRRAGRSHSCRCALSVVRTGGFDDSRLRERVEVLGPQVSLEKLRQSVATSIVDHLGISWDERFGQLVKYKEQYGDCIVPSDWAENKQFGWWVITQRAKRETLSEERLERLTAIGFEWDPSAAVWDKMFSELVQYKEQHGDCSVPHGWVENTHLARWVRKQRQKRESLSEERKDRLTALGFELDPSAATWDKMFTELAQYSDAHGDCSVPHGWAENRQLGIWIGTQRSRKESLSEERQDRLTALGFDWDPFAAAWDKMFAELVHYKEKHGDCKVTKEGAGNKQLGLWVNNQRSKRVGLTEEQRQRLDAIGFEWDPMSATWEKRFAELLQYKEQHGDCNVPQKWAENKKLGSWVTTQRSRRERLPEERQSRLTALGFDWNPNFTAWEKRFAELLQYKEQHGDCNVPDKSIEYKQLGTWVREQKTNAKKGNLTDERRRRLEAIGFRF